MSKRSTKLEDFGELLPEKCPGCNGPLVCSGRSDQVLRLRAVWGSCRGERGIYRFARHLPTADCKRIAKRRAATEIENHIALAAIPRY